MTYVKKEGGIQNALAWTLYDIREKNYMHFNVTGPVPFPTISRLLHKAHENGEEYALERIQALQNDIKQCCSNCGKSGFSNLLLEDVYLLQGSFLFTCSHDCQKEHFEPFQKSICTSENDNFKIE